MSGKLKTAKRGKVTKVIPAHYNEPEKAEIHVQGADPLYSEIRLENSVTDEKGHKAKLKQGAQVEVVIEVESEKAILHENRPH
jgi:hypothetical protein